MQGSSQGLTNEINILFWVIEKVNCCLFKKCFQRFCFKWKINVPNKPPKCCMVFFYCKSKTDGLNFTYQVNKVITYAQAIINYRMGIRRNNQLLFQSAMYKIPDLFHGRNHPFYQIIEVYSLCNYLSMSQKCNGWWGNPSHYHYQMIYSKEKTATLL